MFFSFLILQSCNIIDLTELNVSYYPSERDQIIKEDSTLWVSFSEEVNKDDAEELLQLVGPNGIIEGDFYWTNTKLNFKPYQSLITGYRYNFKYQGELETSSGLNFSVNSDIPFYAGTNESLPVLIDYSPFSGAITNVYEPIKFKFSKAMNTKLFEEYFSVNPSSELDFSWDDDKTTVTISPNKKWTNLSLLEWKLPTKITDSTGEPLPIEYSDNFLIQLDTTSPELMYIVPSILNTTGQYSALTNLSLEDVENSNDIYIEFDEGIDFSSLSSAFSITPDMDGHIKQLSNSKFVYIKGNDFEPDKEYSITIEKGMTDLSGNKIPADLNFTFKPNIPPIVIEDISIIYKGGNISISDAQFNSTKLIQMPASFTYFGSNEKDYALQFVITINTSYLEEEILAKQNLIQTIGCELTFPQSQSYSSPYLYNSNWNASGNSITLEFRGFAIATNDEPIYYKFNMASGSSSSANKSGSYLLDDVYFYFNAQGMNP